MVQENQTELLSIDYQKQRVYFPYEFEPEDFDDEYEEAVLDFIDEIGTELESIEWDNIHNKYYICYFIRD